MITSTQPRSDIFPGYELTERIGSGGYAEVWRARAPGGIEKAVKIVYGCYDDHLAVQELKALERIKDVRHPFVLSLERFEIVDGRLAILTELAEMSMEQRAQQCRAQGLPGIPRDELLHFMSDTAEALDFLSARHSLLHLDIKPANLLISGDHVKVADFGLVKELASRTQNSMVAGMTPTYASPEMFDDAPSPQSDQYSLAIVYQEMLTGVLAFPGRTTAQLANQHLRSPPQLTSLSDIDRRIVARALAKDPAERFPTCGAFAKELRSAAEAQEPPSTGASESQKQSGDAAADHVNGFAPVAPQASRPASFSALAELNARSKHSTLIHLQATAETSPELNAGARGRHSEDDHRIVDVDVPRIATHDDAITPTLYLAVGGVGIRLLGLFRELLARRGCSSDLTIDAIAIDTDRDAVKEACSANWTCPLEAIDALHLPLKLPQMYRDADPERLEWLSHRWLYNIPRSLETRGYRPLGRLALVDHTERVVAAIDRKLKGIWSTESDEEARSTPTQVRIVVLAGMGGGTSGGMAIDLANAARSRLKALGLNGSIEGILICTCLGNTSASPLSIANTYALLTELEIVSIFGNQGAHSNSRHFRELESQCRPFDCAYVLKALNTTSESVDQGLNRIAEQLLLQSTKLEPVLKVCKETKTPRELAAQDRLLLRTFGSSRMDLTEFDRSSNGDGDELADSAHQTLDGAGPDLLQCGYDRRTLLVAPAEHSAAIEAIANKRSTAATICSSVDQPVVYCEGSGINPSALACGFARVYPGIADAAARLFTRVDIEWAKLALQIDA